MRKKIELVFLAAAAGILLAGCSSTKRIVKEAKPEPKTEVKTRLNVIRNNDFEERNFIKSEHLKSVDKIEFDYNFWGNLGSPQKISRVSYDPNGFMTETVFFTKGGKVDQQYKYQYDQNGMRVSTVRYNGDGMADKTYKYEYNKFGNKIKASRYSMAGKLEKYYLYRYDANGNLIEELWYDADGKLEYTIDYTYNGGNKKTKAVSFNANGEQVGKSVYKYDAKGNIIEEDRFKDDDGSPSGIIQYVYKYY